MSRRLARLNHEEKEIYMSQTVSSPKQLKNDAGVARVDMKFEVAIVPISDVDRSKAFYTKLGWRVDDDIVNGNDFRVVQLTPPGSASSISFGKGVTDAAPGSFRGGLIVSDIEAAHRQIVASGIGATEVFHGSPFSPAGRISGPDPERQSYHSYVAFQDPDGNAWIVQEVTRRAPGRIDPTTTTFASANDLANAMRRAAAAHGEREKHNGQRDENWQDWYAAYMAAEQAGTELPK
jgi:catechol 2,3-dioxygenase-like lactoylglutathione lyase family enzyme